MLKGTRSNTGGTANNLYTLMVVVNLIVLTFAAKSYRLKTIGLTQRLLIPFIHFLPLPVRRRG